MGWVTRIIIGSIVSLIGFFVVWKTQWLVGMVGKSEWAEWNMGSFGGSNMLYKLIGIIILFVGFMFITNLHAEFFNWILSPLTRAGI